MKVTIQLEVDDPETAQHIIRLAEILNIPLYEEGDRFYDNQDLAWLLLVDGLESYNQLINKMATLLYSVGAKMRHSLIVAQDSVGHGAPYRKLHSLTKHLLVLIPTSEQIEEAKKEES